MTTTRQTTVTTEADVRRFAVEFPTEQAQRAVALCEAGTLTWEQVGAVFGKAIRVAVATVQAKVDTADQAR